MFMNIGKLVNMYRHVCTMFSDVRTVLPILVQVVRIPDECSSATPVKKNRPSPSGRRAGSAPPPQRALHLCTKSSNVTTLCFDNNPIKVPSSRNYPFCHEHVGYCRCFSHSAGNSHCYSLLSSAFELESFPHLHRARCFR